MAGPGRVLGTGIYEAATTMSNDTPFSTSNMSLNFTTAGHQLKNAPDLACASSDSAPPAKKPKLSKATSAQGNLMGFFSKPALPIQPPESSVLPEIRPPHQQTEQYREAEQAWRRFESDSLGFAIPEDLSSHKLDFRRGMHHRPNGPLRDVNTNIRSRYAGLYSSPPPPDSDEKQMSAGDLVDENDLIYVGQTKRSTRDIAGENGLTYNGESKHAAPPRADTARLKALASAGSSRPATTMHNTSMSTLGNGDFSSTSFNPGVGRKTLGVRRTLGQSGWNNRKHR